MPQYTRDARDLPGNHSASQPQRLAAYQVGWTNVKPIAKWLALSIWFGYECEKDSARACEKRTANGKDAETAEDDVYMVPGADRRKA